MSRQACLYSTWSIGDLVISTTACKFYGIIARGSATASSFTVINHPTVTGTATVFVIGIATTVTGQVVLNVPVAMNAGLSVDATGSASFTVLYGV